MTTVLEKAGRKLRWGGDAERIGHALGTRLETSDWVHNVVASQSSVGHGPRRMMLEADTQTVQEMTRMLVAAVEDLRDAPEGVSEAARAQCAHIAKPLSEWTRLIENGYKLEGKRKLEAGDLCEAGYIGRCVYVFRDLQQHINTLVDIGYRHRVGQR